MGQAVELVTAGWNLWDHHPVLLPHRRQQGAAQVTGPSWHCRIDGATYAGREPLTLEHDAVGSAGRHAEDDHVIGPHRECGRREPVVVLTSVRDELHHMGRLCGD